MSKNIDVEIELEREVKLPNGEMDYDVFMVVCNLDAVPAEKGARDSYGVQLEPDYDAGFDFNYAIRKDNGEEIKLTDKEIQEAINEAADYMQAEYEASQEYEPE